MPKSVKCVKSCAPCLLSLTFRFFLLYADRLLKVEQSKSIRLLFNIGYLNLVTSSSSSRARPVKSPKKKLTSSQFVDEEADES